MDGLGEMLDHDLDQRERGEILEQLTYISTHTEDQDLINLSEALLTVLSAENLYVIPRATSFWRRLTTGARSIETRWLNQKTLKALLGSAMVVLAALSLRFILEFLLRLPGGGWTYKGLLETIFLTSTTGGGELGWLSARITLEAVLGGLLLISAALLVAGREQRGVQIGRLSLIAYLIVLDVIIFYTDQFATIGLVCVQLIIIWGLAHYQRQHLEYSEHGIRKVSQ
jgi:hypothetical protein